MPLESNLNIISDLKPQLSEAVLNTLKHWLVLALMFGHVSPFCHADITKQSKLWTVALTSRVQSRNLQCPILVRVDFKSWMCNVWNYKTFFFLFSVIFTVFWFRKSFCLQMKIYLQLVNILPYHIHLMLVKLTYLF